MTASSSWVGCRPPEPEVVAIAVVCFCGHPSCCMFLPSSQPLFVFAVILNEVKDPDASQPHHNTPNLSSNNPQLSHPYPNAQIKNSPHHSHRYPRNPSLHPRTSTGAPSMTASSSWMGCKTSVPQVLPLPVPASHSP